MSGQQIDTIRKAMNVSKKDLADALSMSRPTLDMRLYDPSLFTLGEIEVLCQLLKIKKSAIIQD